MKKLLVLFFTLLLCSCSLTLDPAGKLVRTMPTSTSTATRAAPSITASPTAETCQVTGDLNLRAAPSADSQVIDWLLTGQTVIATSGESAGWRAVRNWAGAKGYVNVKWLECGK